MLVSKHQQFTLGQVLQVEHLSPREVGKQVHYHHLNLVLRLQVNLARNELRTHLLAS